MNLKQMYKDTTTKRTGMLVCKKRLTRTKVVMEADGGLMNLGGKRNGYERWRIYTYW